jgi:putative peptidoglycan lipid II flippase
MGSKASPCGYALLVRTDDAATTGPSEPAPIGRVVRTVSSLTLVSRFAGLARDLITVRVFGDTAVGSAFVSAFTIPNTFRRLFGEGALAAAFIPEYASTLRDDPQTANRFASLTIALLALLTGAITIVGELVVLALLVFLPSNAERSLSLQLIMAMLPFMPMICVAATLGGMLQIHDRFGPQAAQPIVLNAFIILAASTHFFVPGASATRTAFVIGGAAVAAGAVQVLWTGLALRRHVRWTRVFTGVGDRVRRMLKRYVPVLVGLGTLQINALLDTIIAMWPIWVGPMIFGMTYPLNEASASILFFSQRLYQFPLGVFGISVATAVFPMLARRANDNEAFTETLRRGIRLSLFIGLPASAGLWLVRHDLIAVMFTGGGSGFSTDGAARAVAVLAGYSPAIWAYSLNHVLTRAFYAKGDTRTPVVVSVAMVALNLVLNLTLIWKLGEAGMAWATSITAVLQCLILTRLSRTLVTGKALFDRETMRAIAQTLSLSALMVVLVVLTVWLMPDASTWGARLGSLIAASVVGGVSYLALSRAVRSTELRWLLHRDRPGS